MIYDNSVPLFLYKFCASTFYFPGTAPPAHPSRPCVSAALLLQAGAGLKAIYTSGVPVTSRPGKLQFQVLEEISEVRPDILALRDHNLLLGFILCLFQGFHAQADLAVFDADDLHIDFVSYVQNVRRKFYTLL